MEATIDCPTFIDLRAFAAQRPIAPGKDPFGADRRILPLSGGPVEAGCFDLAAGEGAAAEAPGDCWMIVADGAVSIGGASMQPGDSWVVRGGSAFTWSASAPATLIYLRHLSGAAQGGGITAIDTTAELAPSNPPLTDLLIGETPSCRSHNTFRSDDGEFTCGVWDSTAYHRRPMHYRHIELMYLLEGSVTFVDAAGREQMFAKNDIFIVEQGAECSWESRQHVAKVFALYRPAA